MGDHRASIKITFDFHGKKYKMDSWINYWPEECCGMDKRVVEFFNQSYADGMNRFEEKLAKFRAKEDKERIEAEEKETLKRLQEKYKS